MPHSWMRRLNIKIHYHVNQNLNRIFCGIRQNNSKIHMEALKCKSNQDNSKRKQGQTVLAHRDMY